MLADVNDKKLCSDKRLMKFWGNNKRKPEIFQRKKFQSLCVEFAARSLLTRSLLRRDSQLKLKQMSPALMCWAGGDCLGKEKLINIHSCRSQLNVFIILFCFSSFAPKRNSIETGLAGRLMLNVSASIRIEPVIGKRILLYGLNRISQQIMKTIYAAGQWDGEM